MNAERILIASECVGDAKWFIAKASSYAKERVVFGRRIGQNQGIQFPIAKAYASMRAAELMVREATRNMKLASIAARKPTWPRCWRRTPPGSWQRLRTDIWRLRLRRGIRHRTQIPRDALYQVAPISTNLILSHLAEHVLGLPAPTEKR